MPVVRLIRPPKKLQDCDNAKLLKIFAEVSEYDKRSDYCDEVWLTPSESGMYIKFEFLKEGKTLVVATINAGDFIMLATVKAVCALEQIAERAKKGL